MKIMLLGASGFVGTNIVPSLMSSGVEVLAVSRTKVKNRFSGLRWLTPDAPPQSGVDALVSFAGVGTPANFEVNPQSSLATELSIADWVSDMAQRHDIPFVIYLSTAGAIYGEGWRSGKGSVFSETSHCNPLSVYGQAKLIAETRLRKELAIKQPKSQLCILRASNLYGKSYNKDGRQGLINTLIARAISKQPVMIYGDAKVFRDYLYVDDLTSAIMAAVNLRADGLFNIAMGRSHSILEVIETVELLASVTLKKIYQPKRVFDIKYCAFCIDKAKHELVWNPKVNLEQGVAQVMRQIL